MRALKWTFGGVAAVAIAAALTVGTGSYGTERDIRAFQDEVADIASANPFEVPDQAALLRLPQPVQRYIAFAFPNGIPEVQLVRLTSEGQFRRPQTEGFNFTTAEQVIAVREPALMFSATTPIVPGVWARAYDFFANGEMEMKAKILSTVTVMDESETPELNVISLRRWLLEAALYPHALLPGGPVTWEPVNATSARAIVAKDGLQSSMVVHFDASGAITHMVADEDGDLATPYHGSGEHVTRGDYREVQGIMIPHAFVISRMSGDDLFPFFDARLTSLTFE